MGSSFLKPSGFVFTAVSLRVSLRNSSAESTEDVLLGDLENLAGRIARQQGQGVLDDVRRRNRQCMHRSGRHDFAHWKKLHRRAS